MLDAYDGQLLWIGDAGEKVIGVDDRYVLVRGVDGSTVDAHELGVTGDRWNRRLDGKSTGALTPYAAVLVGDEPDRVIAVNPGTGADLANLRTRADVLAVGPSGMIIGEGREIGLRPLRRRPRRRRRLRPRQRVRRRTRPRALPQLRRTEERGLRTGAQVALPLPPG